jgi:hypothetical protein
VSGFAGLHVKLYACWLGNHLHHLR